MGANDKRKKSSLNPITSKSGELEYQAVSDKDGFCMVAREVLHLFLKSTRREPRFEALGSVPDGIFGQYKQDDIL